MLLVATETRRWGLIFRGSFRAALTDGITIEEMMTAAPTGIATSATSSSTQPGTSAASSSTASSSTQPGTSAASSATHPAASIKLKAEAPQNEDPPSEAETLIMEAPSEAEIVDHVVDDM